MRRIASRLSNTSKHFSQRRRRASRPLRVVHPHSSPRMLAVERALCRIARATHVERRHPKRVSRAVRARASRGFDPNDPLTWNATANDDDDDDDAYAVVNVGAGVEDVQALTDADLAALIGVAGASSPQMVDDAALAALRAEEAEETRSANDCGSCIAEGRRLYEQGEYENALMAFERAATLPGSGPVRYRSAVVKPAGPSAGFKPRERSSGEEIAIAYNLACCHARLGNVDAGLASLKSALERGYDEYPAIRADADIAVLREDSRFEAIMARFEPQSTMGKLFDAFNGPKKGVSLFDGIKNIFDK